MAIKTQFMELWNRKQLNENRRITLTEITEQSGLGWATINRWKQGDVNRFDADVLSALCRYFNCQVADLLVYVPNEAADESSSD